MQTNLGNHNWSAGSLPTLVPSSTLPASGYSPVPVLNAPTATNQPSRDSSVGFTKGGSTKTDLIHVLHVINGEHFSGAERVQLHLANQLPTCGFAADFACLKPGKFRANHTASLGEVFDVPMRSRFDASVALRVAKLARQLNAKLLHAHTPRSALIASQAAAITKLPWVYHVHSPAAKDSANSWRNRINNWVERWSLRNCAHQITVSRSLRHQVLQTRWPENRVTVVHNGVPAVCPERTRKPGENDEWVLGMVALMRPRKGLEVLLDAVRCALSTNLNVRLRCIGPFETEAYQRFIEGRIEKLRLSNHVEFVGFTQNVGAELAKLDALVLPSLFGEGLPMVVLEAMAAGLPVIATAVEGTPEAIIDRQHGLLAEPGSAGSLAAALACLVHGSVDWHDLSRAAKTRHAECFSDVAMARGVAAVYNRVIAAAN